MCRHIEPPGILPAVFQTLALGNRRQRALQYPADIFILIRTILTVFACYVRNPTVLEVFILKKITIRCPYCGAKATLRPSSVVYGERAKSGGYLYVCDRYPKCDAYVGAHQKTTRPMGTLANGDLRHKRIEAHKVFDQMWKSGLMTKWQAYRWMQGKFALNEDQAHIAKFSEYMCDQLIAACNQVYENLHMAA